MSFLFLIVGSHRISDSEISDYDCEDGVGVMSGNDTPLAPFIDVCYWCLIRSTTDK